MEKNVYNKLKAVYIRHHAKVENRIMNASKTIYGFEVSDKVRMGLTCSSTAQKQENLHQRLSGLANQFVCTWCEKSEENNVQSMVLLQEFQRFVMNNMDRQSYDEWTSNYSPYDRLNILLDNDADVRYQSSSRQIVQGLSLRSPDVMFR